MPITTEQVTLSDHQGAIRPGSSTSTALVSARTSQRQPSQRRTDSLDAAGERGTLGHLEAYLGEVAVCDSVLNAVEGKH